MKRPFIAYQGELFTIEWYFDDKGNSPALEYYKELSFQQQNKLDYLFEVLSNSGKIRNEEKFRYEGDQIYAFKPAPNRFLCFFYEGSRVIVTNAYVKKTDKMPPREKTKAIIAKADYIKRYKKGIYYE
jgi:phage-related protein